MTDSQAKIQTQEAISAYAQKLANDPEHMRLVNMTAQEFKAFQIAQLQAARKAEPETFRWTDQEIDALASEMKPPASPDQWKAAASSMAKGHEDEILALIKLSEKKFDMRAKALPQASSAERASLAAQLENLGDAQVSRLSEPLKDIVKTQREVASMRVDLFSQFSGEQYDKSPASGYELSQAAQLQGEINSLEKENALKAAAGKYRDPEYATPKTPEGELTVPPKNQAAPKSENPVKGQSK